MVVVIVAVIVQAVVVDNTPTSPKGLMVVGGWILGFGTQRMYDTS